VTSKDLIKIIRLATERLREAGIDTPQLDAEVMLAHVLGVKRVDLILDKDTSLTTEQAEMFSSLVEERIKRRPVSQIINTKGFWSKNLYVDERVLTPRPETEGIVERAITLFPKDAEIDILDLCTGSGCIAAALADEFPRAHITATDISSDTIEVARKNLEFAKDRVTLLQGDLFWVFQDPGSSIQDLVSSFNLIVSNPPYIPESELETLPPEVKNYEPAGALAGGPDGLAILIQIAKDAPQHLKSGGWVVLEMGHDQAERMKKHLIGIGKYTNIMIDKDLAGIERVISAQKQ
jgi:release factor glutamine methyltransferase